MRKGHGLAELGSSPRLWGTFLGTSIRLVQTRFIPTPVGNIDPLGRRPYFSAVHPHACGEHKIMFDLVEGSGGSSPRLWGTYAIVQPVSIQERFIPTPVGNILVGAGAGCLHTVHPHACGEHARIHYRRIPEAGSSPRLWGTSYGPAELQDAHRFIPTPVGNIPAASFTSP